MLDFKKYGVMSFDCYGTLIDWERGILAALKPVLTAHNVKLKDEQTRAFIMILFQQRH